MDKNEASIKITISFEDGNSKELSFKEAYQIYRQLHEVFGKDYVENRFANKPMFLVDGIPKYHIKPEQLRKTDEPKPSTDPDNWRVTFK